MATALLWFIKGEGISMASRFEVKLPRNHILDLGISLLAEMRCHCPSMDYSMVFLSGSGCLLTSEGSSKHQWDQEESV